MIIKGEQVRIWNGGNYKTYTKRKNVDTKELTKWMRELASIKAFGLVELPIWKGKAISRFIVLDSLQNGSCIISYSVMKNGLKRNFIPIDSKRFTNNAHCTFMSGLSKEKVMVSILKHKDGKRVLQPGLERIQKWIKDWKAYKKQGGYQIDPIRIVLEKCEMSNMGLTLKENYSMEDLKAVCEGLIQNEYEFDKQNLYPEQESFGYMSGHKPEVYTTY